MLGDEVILCHDGPMIGESLLAGRAELLQFLAREIVELGEGRRLIGIDGADGSGKTTFTASLAASIRDRPVVTIHLDDFLNLQEVRHRRGRASPEGFWLDTYDYAAFQDNVLTPLRRIGDGKYRPAVTDARQNQRLELPLREAPEESLVLVEGMFLHRDELMGRWDYSIFLDVPFTETARRMSVRDGGNPDPEHPSMRRYVGGQRLYFEAAEPWSRATRAVDNTQPDEPRLLSLGEASKRRR